MQPFKNCFTRISDEIVKCSPNLIRFLFVHLFFKQVSRQVHGLSSHKVCMKSDGIDTKVYSVVVSSMTVTIPVFLGFPHFPQRMYYVYNQK